ncbi:hypothetical protein RB2150_09959 [Rhodobacterales bacterium HTCC2150]|nr:hypothetical protein RB2150_09959 [Rhodobacterales bacterium HTCC2150] [Rhodobacteraceae bacterium HTCC2150]
MNHRESADQAGINFIISLDSGAIW